MTTPKVVILCLENRSFDEYFGTFPGAIGFTDPNGAAIFPQTGFVSPPPANQSIASLYPYRLSTFSSFAGEQTFGCNHSWWNQQTSFALETSGPQLNGWAAAQNYPSNLPPPGLSQATGTLGYFAANDIPYLWQLAQNFLLCDTYFCSVLGSTIPNRMFLMSGTVFGAAGVDTPADGEIAFQSQTWIPVIDNPPSAQNFPWPSYPSMLPRGTGLAPYWKLYDDQSWQAPWLTWPLIETLGDRANEVRRVAP
jgi:phospholipase C